MSEKKYIQRILPAGFGTAALSGQPACAAVCPRGRSECPYPGRCSLYIDADGNSLCDYTYDEEGISGSGVAGTGGSGNTADSLSAINPADIALLVLIAIAMSAIFYLIYLGINNKDITETKLIFLRISYLLPLLAVIYIFLNYTEISGIPEKTADIIDLYSGITYLIFGTVIAAYLHKTGRMSRDVIIPVLMITLFAGFLFVAPLAPDGFHSQIQGLISANLVTLGFISMIFISAVVLLSGRVFCGQICPVGAVQELLFMIPVKKISLGNNNFPKTVRAFLFIVLAAGVILSVNVAEYAGTSYFFGLLFYSAGFFIFSLFLIISVFLYRPFCMFVCPYGLIFSLIGIFSRNKIMRTDSCINCGKCERACPSGVAGRDGIKDECYLCGRCLNACPVKKALIYDSSGILTGSDGSDRSK